MGRRRSELDEFIDALTGVPAWMGPGLAFAVFATLRWLLPIFTPAGEGPQAIENLTFSIFGRVATGLAPLAAGIVLAAWLIAELHKWNLRRAARSPRPAATSATPPACPCCQSSMVLRTATRGPNVGKPFWGCSRYPNCRAIIPSESV